MDLEKEYFCKTCGKPKSQHKAITFNCPVKGRGNFKGFIPDQYYEPNPNRPIKTGFKI